MSDLRPCPFCASTRVRLVTDAPEEWVDCMSCGASGGTDTYHKSGGDIWNHRPVEQALHKLLDALEASGKTFGSDVLLAVDESYLVLGDERYVNLAGMIEKAERVLRDE